MRDDEIELTEEQWRATEPDEYPAERDDPREGERSHPETTPGDETHEGRRRLWPRR